MAEGDRSPVDVDDRVVDPEQPGGMDRHGRESLVDLDQAQIRCRQPRSLEGSLQRHRGDRVERRVPVGGHAVGDDLGERRDAELVRPFGAHHHDGARAVGDL
jgi:hypothetical protein